MPFTFTENQTQAAAIRAAVSRLGRVAVSVGVPPENDARPGPLSNSALLALHEHGSPVNRVPPRPVLQPALSLPETRAAMEAGLLAACEAAARGDEAAMDAALRETGEAGAQAVKDYISSGATAPNAPFTLAGGWSRNRVSGKPFHADPKAGSTPLVNTGALRDAIGWKVEEK